MPEAEMSDAEIRWRERQMEHQERAEAMAKSLTDWVNGADFEDVKIFATALSHQHRTNQQSVFGAFLQFSKVLAHKNRLGEYDARNEYACQTAVKIMEVTEDAAACPFI